MATVDLMDIHAYMFAQESYISRKQLKANKSLEAYNFVMSGWVKNPRLKPLPQDEVLVITDVNHSQNLSAAPITSWLWLKLDGESY